MSYCVSTDEQSRLIPFVSLIQEIFMSFVFKDNKIFIVDSSLKDIFVGDHFEFKKYLGGRWVGGFMFGNACTPVVDSCQCMAKPIQYCKVK